MGRSTRGGTVAALLAAMAGVLGCADRGAARVPEWTLVETLRIGGAEEGPAALDYVKGLAVDASGRIHVYDRSTQDLRVFAPDGRLERVIGRKGSGPGELRDAEGIAFDQDGRLWVRDAANARFSIFGADGTFESAWGMQFCSSQGEWVPRRDDRGRLVDDDCMVVDGRGDGYGVLAYRTDRSGVDTLGMRAECGTRALAEQGTWITKLVNGMRYQQIPWAPRAAWALTATGALWCAPNSATYEVLRLGVGGRDTLRVVGAAAPVPVTAAERDSVIAGLEEGGPTGLDYARIPSTKPAIDRLTVDDEGRLWVRRTEADGAIVFDLYDAGGAPVAVARLGRVATSTWAPFVVRGDDVYAVVAGTDDVLQVVRYRLTR